LGVSSQFLPGRKGFFPVKTPFFPWEGKKYLSSGKKPNPDTNITLTSISPLISPNHTSISPILYVRVILI
jgi:hypothetical protein